MLNIIPETRDRILNATLDCLKAADGRMVRISDVADAAGLTRQTLYLYFKNRADLLIAATHYLDERLHQNHTVEDGIVKFEAYVEAWASYIPKIYGVAHALLHMNDADADAAWQSKMQDMWEDCEAAIKDLDRDENLNPDYSIQEASDLLWTLLSIQNWERLCRDKGWSQEEYLRHMQKMTKLLFVAQRTLF